MLPDSLYTYVSTNYLLRTADDPPAFITVQTTGWRKGPHEALERLFDPSQASQVDPSEYSFRLSIKLETGDARYSDIVNGDMWIGSGARMASEGMIPPIMFGVLLSVCSDLRCVSSYLSSHRQKDIHHGSPSGYADALRPAAQLSCLPSQYCSFALLRSTPSCG